MYNKEEVYNNIEKSLETLEFILEISFGKELLNVKIPEFKPSFNQKDGLFDINGILVLDISCSDNDITSIIKTLSNVNSKFNDVFDSYLVSYDGKLIKNKNQNETMVINYMVSDMKYNIDTDSLNIVFVINSFDM